MSRTSFTITAIKKENVADFSLDGSSNFALRFFIDACIHLRSLKDVQSEFKENPNGFLKVEWDMNSNEYKNSIKGNIFNYHHGEISFLDLQLILEFINNHFETFFNYIRPKVAVEKIGSFKTWFGETCKSLTPDNYKIAMGGAGDFRHFCILLRDFARNCTTDNPVILKSEGFSFNEIKGAFDYIFKELEIGNPAKKPFIDFDTLTFNGLLDYI